VGQAGHEAAGKPFGAPEDHGVTRARRRSDLEAIHGAGVPVLALNQDAGRYFDYHHTADDTLAIVDPVQLRQNVAAWTATLAIIADSDVTFRGGKKK
jgi:Zn-dependent M28 family amino/carboxypeptidase